MRIEARLLALLTPLLLVGCVLTPGKFISLLVVNKDRSFTFSYQGEVIALDFAKAFAKGMGAAGSTPSGESDEALTPSAERIAWQEAAASDDDDAKNRAIAEALRREPGYRRVDYLGEGKFSIDYQLSGRLTHNFVYPYNLDAEAIFPFLVLELRGRDTVRMKAPAFGGSDKTDQSPATSDMASQRDGSFTLDTDAEIVSQNNEDGPTPAAARRRITWRVTPITKDAPMAVLRVGAL